MDIYNICVFTLLGLFCCTYRYFFCPLWLSTYLQLLFLGSFSRSHIDFINVVFVFYNGILFFYLRSFIHFIINIIPAQSKKKKEHYKTCKIKIKYLSLPYPSSSKPFPKGRNFNKFLLHRLNIVFSL